MNMLFEDRECEVIDISPIASISIVLFLEWLNLEGNQLIFLQIEMVYFIEPRYGASQKRRIKLKRC